jgi:hypothetical protein
VSQTESAADAGKEPVVGLKNTSIAFSDSKTEDLAILGKVWGFLKYYHPAVANGDFDWDEELIKVLPEILGTENPSDRNSALSKWVVSTGPVIVDKKNKFDNKEVKIYPDLAWIDSTILGSKLTLQLTEIKNARRTGSNYYVSLAPGVGNPDFTNEKPYDTMKYPDAGFRLLSLYRYWNIIQYYFPYKNLIEENWNEVLPEFIPKFLDASNELEYKLAVLSLIARVHDTHANIWGKDSTLRQYRGMKYAPVEITFVENKAVVTGYTDQILGVQSGLMTGDVITSINYKPTESIVEEALPFTPASNYPTQLRDIARNLLRTNDSLLTIVFDQGDSKLVRQIRCYGSDQLNFYKKYDKNDTCFKMINPDIAYIYPGSIKSEYLPKIMEETFKGKGLIIDLRCYPSDFIVFSLSDYLLPESTPFVKFSEGSITSPGLFTMTNNLEVGRKNKNHFKGKVVVIVNEITQSQAEYTTMAFRVAPGATVIGSTTAGADGNVSQFSLPGGISTMISGIGVYYPDGRETQRVGIIPDVEVKPTIKGITEGKDELLEKAIDIINGK